MLKLMVLNIIFVCTIGTYQLAYEGDRLVDIPVPPNSSGHADFTSEEGEQQAKEYEQEEKMLEEKQDKMENSMGKEEEEQTKRRQSGIVGTVGVLLILGVSIIYRKKSKKS